MSRSWNLPYTHSSASSCSRSHLNLVLILRLRAAVHGSARRTARVQRGTRRRRRAWRRRGLYRSVSRSSSRCGSRTGSSHRWTARQRLGHRTRHGRRRWQGITGCSGGSSGALVVAAQRGQRAGGGEVGEGRRAHAHAHIGHSGVKIVRQRLLHGGGGGRLAVIYVNAGVGRRSVGSGSSSGGGSGSTAASSGRIGPGAQVRRSAVEPLEGGKVASLRQEFQADGGLALPLSPGNSKKIKKYINLNYEKLEKTELPT